jgi:protoporphyrin/coproporphyrin ferrochelatase
MSERGERGAAPRTGVLVMAYGTPRQADEIEPYYTDIRRGRAPTPELLADLVRRYEAIGGLSPLAQRTVAQRAALQRALDAVEPGRYEVALGLKHATPSIEDGLRGLTRGGAGVEEVVGLVLAPHYSAFSVGQYLERVEAAGAAERVPVTGIRSWHLEPAYLEFLVAAVRRQLAVLPTATTVLFTAHSLPERILATGDPYPEQLQATAAAVAERAGLATSTWDVAWQSAGRTPEPWLGPDVLAAIDGLADRGDVDGVLVCACGFVADHLEVRYDLDIEARSRAVGRGLAFARTACVNDDREVMTALASLVVDRVTAPR